MICSSRSDNRSAKSRARTISGAVFLHLSLTSGHTPGPFNISAITTVSDAIHPKLAAQLVGTPPGHYGCILLDFADPKLCQLIYHKHAMEK